MRSWPILLVLGSLLAMPFAARAQEGAPSISEDPGTATLSDSMNGASRIGPWGGYLYFRKNFDNGVGYRNGFTNLGWFQPFQFSDDSAFFGQGNLFVTDDGQVGGNIGGGFRSYSPNTNSVMGVYGFFDFDESVNGNRYDQFSLGAEFRGQRMDMTANIYVPFTNERNFLALRSLNGPLFLQGHYLYVTGAALFEKAMPGGDFEVGFPVLDPSALGRVRGYLGAYAYDSPAKDPIGLRARVEAHINQYATVGGAIMHDDVHGAFATFAVELRGWNRRLPELAHNNDYNRAKMYLPVTRQYRVAVDQYDTGDFETPALGADGTPIDFVWVNNGNAAPGSGTFEDPYHDMPANAPGADYILVYEGPSSTANPVLGGITLQDGQRLYGEGFEFFIDVAGTRFGPRPQVVSITDIVPNWNTTGQSPYVSNPGGSFVTLANDNEVRSFNIINTLGPAITGNGINNFDLRDLNIGVPGFGNAAEGILLTNASGVGTIDNFTMWGNAGGGIIINNTNTAPLALAINGSTTVDPNVIGGGPALQLTADNSMIIANANAMAGTGINDFRSTGAESGLYLEATNGGLVSAGVDNSTFDDTTVGDGVGVLANTNGTVVLEMTDSTAINAAANGMLVNVASGGLFTGDVSGTALGGASFSGAGQHGVAIFTDGSSMMNSLTFLNTTINGSGQAMMAGDNDGLHIELINGSYFNVAFQDGEIVGSGGDAIDVFEDGASTLDLLVEASLLTDSGENGFLFELHNGSVLNGTFAVVDLSRSGQAGILGAGNGIHGIMDSNTLANLMLTDTIVDQSNEHGLFLDLSGGAVLNGSTANASISDSNQSGGLFDGIHVTVDGMGTVATLDLEDTQVDNTMAGGGMQQNALDFFVDNNGQFLFTAGPDGAFGAFPSSFSNAVEDGILGRVHNGGLADLTFDATTIDDSGSFFTPGDGFDLLVDSAGTLNVAVLNGSSVNDSSRNGFLASASGMGSTLDILIDDSTVDSNGFNGLFGDGMNLTADMGASLSATVQNGSSVDNNGLGGIVLAATDTGTTADLTVSMSTVDGNNGGDGINLSVSGAADLNADIVNGSSVSNNDQSGIELAATNAGTTADLTVTNSMVNGNQGGSGADISVSDEAAFTGDISGSSFDGNDQDGLALSATDNNTTADLTIAASTFDDNVNGTGLNLMAQNMADLTTNVTGPSSASGNGVDGVNLLVDGAGTTATANFDQLSADNNMDDGFDVLVTNAAQLDMTVTGGSTGSFNMDNGFILTANDGTASIVHLNMTDGNAFNDNVNGYGIFVDASGIAELEAVVSGGASRNALDGARLQASMVNTITAIGATGPGGYSANGGNGLIIDLSNTVNPINQVLVSDLSADGNALTGVSILAESETITDILIDAALVSNSMGGDGMLVDLNNSLVETLTVSNGGSATNLLNGLNIDLDNTTVNNLNVVDNNTGGVGGIVGLEFIISGSTNPLMGNPQGVFAITNTSAAADVTGFLFDISPSNAGMQPVFDTLNSMLGFKFLPFGGTDATTGLSTINGVAVVPPIVDVAGTDNTMDSMGTVLVGGGIPNNTPVMDLGFADFQTGETFQWDIDVDPAPNVDQGINGNQLAGSFIHVDFAGGLFIEGNLVQTGPQTSEFMATSGNISSPGFSENGLDGILINAHDTSAIGAMTIDNNLVDMNGQHGIEVIAATDSTLPGPGAPSIVSNNEITNHAAGDGFHLVNPDTNNNAIGFAFSDNTITDNTGGAGVNISLDTNSADGTASLLTFDGNDISRNGSFGVRIDAGDDVMLDMQFGQTPGADQNIIDGNADAGVGITLSDTVMASLAFSNTAITNTVNGPNPDFDGDGLRVVLADFAQLDMPVLGGTDPLMPDTEFSGNAGRGISLELNQASVLLDPTTIQNSLINDNGSHGIEILRFADSFLDDVLITGNQINGNGGDGINFTWQGGLIDTVNGGTLIIDADIVGNQINMNDGNGVFVGLDADVNTEIDILNNEIDNSGDAGIAARLRFDSVMDGLWDDNVITNSGRLTSNDGINVTLTERTLVGTGSGFTISNSQISDSSRDGIRFDTGTTVPAGLVFGVPLLVADIVDNGPQFPGDLRGITGNGAMGINLLADSDSVIDVFAGNNLIVQNGLDGVHANAAGTSDIFLDATGNTIEWNLRHGVNLETSGTDDDPDMVVTLTDNSISRNAERGVTLVNRGEGDTTLNIIGSVDPVPSLGANATSRIEQNGEIGIYVENNAGALGTNNNISLTIFQTAVLGNGANVGATAFDRNGVVLRAGTSSSGALTATVDRNIFSGNGNIDFVVESFVATPTPTGADPLARLGLILTDNVGDSIDLVRNGATYNNASATKSPRALYGSNTRPRNAQRFTQSFGPLPADVVQAAPAPTTTTFAGTGLNENSFPGSAFLDLGVNVGGAGSTITGYNAGTNVFTVAPAFGAAPAAGAPIVVQGGTVSGAGRSTFRTPFATVALGGNSFTNVLSDFDDFITLTPNFTYNGVFFDHDFEWSLDATPFTFDP